MEMKMIKTKDQYKCYKLNLVTKIDLWTGFNGDGKKCGLLNKVWTYHT
jgi:hypothetical protein